MLHGLSGEKEFLGKRIQTQYCHRRLGVQAVSALMLSQQGKGRAAWTF